MLPWVITFFELDHKYPDKMKVYELFKEYATKQEEQFKERAKEHGWKVRR